MFIQHQREPPSPFGGNFIGQQMCVVSHAGCNYQSFSSRSGTGIENQRFSIFLSAFCLIRQPERPGCKNRSTIQIIWRGKTVIIGDGC
ncbi:MAG: hypothetical protein FWG27_04140 [Treponema sp.]|nr:hypothetical protein [Treponema sp.]